MLNPDLGEMRRKICIAALLVLLTLSGSTPSSAEAAPEPRGAFRLRSSAKIFACRNRQFRALRCASTARRKSAIAVRRLSGRLYTRPHQKRLEILRAKIKKSAGAGKAAYLRAKRRLLSLRAAMDALCAVCAPYDYPAGDAISPLELDNTKSGISIALSGRNGADWAVERTFHDTSSGDQVIYLKSCVDISLAHNSWNTITKRDSTSLPAAIGADGPDGIPDSGDEGDIHFKIDRDMQAHLYNTKGSNLIPSYAPRYAGPFSLGILTYDGTRPILGSVGDNGGPWGTHPRNTVDRYAYGQTDAFGNECHTLTYWDDDEPLFRRVYEDSHRQGASDGHWVYLCVNPLTPVIQFIAPPGQEYYTTPLKTYHIPKTWLQTTYLTSGVQIAFFNLTNSEPVYFRIDGGAWHPLGEKNFIAGGVFPRAGEPVLLEAKAGLDGPILRRAVVMDPPYPAAGEQHGFLLWADENDRAGVVQKIKTIQPFKRSYEIFTGSYYQGLNETFDDARGEWRAAASQAGTALSNAFTLAVDGAAARAGLGLLAKKRLLRLARLEPVGNEQDINSATPAKDYLNELGQTIQEFADAGVAYDLLAKHFRRSDHPDGMSPIEELRIRDGLAEIVKTTIQHRDNYSYTSGSGDTHWPHGYELAIGIIALAMPTYKTPYFGASGGDRVTINDGSDGQGKFWNPLPDQGITWYEAATDPEVGCPGYPNNKAPPRAEFQISDDGFWTGPNDLVGDGERYVVGPAGERLVDVKYGGLSNAENRVELVEMAGYESPFVARITILDYMRRIKGDLQQQPAVTTYIRRRLLNGYQSLLWDPGLKRYAKAAPRISSSIYAYNNEYDYAALTPARTLVSDFLVNLKRYYGYASGSYPSYIEDDRKVLYNAYALALFCDPSQIAEEGAGVNHAPIIKPTFKYVVKPGETVYKELLISDLDDDPLTVNVSDLPPGASYDSAGRVISWTPGSEDVGVHIVRISASDGRASAGRPFPIIVKPDAGSGSLPAAPQNVQAAVDAANTAHLSWGAPPSSGAEYYVIYRDGSLQDVVPGSQLSYADREPLPAGSHTRYHVALYAPNGAESSAAEAAPAMISVAR